MTIVEFTAAQRRLLAKVRKERGAVYLRGTEVRSARVLEELGFGTLRDDGQMVDAWGHVDGERWFFTLKEGLR